jgi:hypothetical protein
MFSRQQQSSHIGGNRSKDFNPSTPSRGAALSQNHTGGGRGGYSTRTAAATTTTLDKVPSAVAASDGSESNVSSVTEEASSFHRRALAVGDRHRVGTKRHKSWSTTTMCEAKISSEPRATTTMH